jgi:hypothetical protein
VSAVLVAAFYKVLNKLRHGMVRADNFRRQFDRFIDDAIRGHSNYLYSLILARRVHGTTQTPTPTPKIRARAKAHAQARSHTHSTRNNARPAADAPNVYSWWIA